MSCGTITRTLLPSFGDIALCDLLLSLLHSRGRFGAVCSVAGPGRVVAITSRLGGLSETIAVPPIDAIAGVRDTGDLEGKVFLPTYLPVTDLTTDNAAAEARIRLWGT